MENHQGKFIRVHDRYISSFLENVHFYEHFNLVLI